MTFGEPVAVVRAAPACRFTLTGIKLPPIRRKATSPPNDLALLLAPSGFQVEKPAVTSMFDNPSVARAPKALPFPELLSGLP